MSQTKAQLISDLVQALAFVGTSSAPTNGMYLSAANTLAISTNGSQRLTVSTTGVTSTLPVDVALGSVTAPTYSFTGDLNTGMWSPAADTVAISTGGSERVRVTSSGQWLVGTSSAIAGKQSQQRTLQIAKAQAGTDQGAAVFHFDAGGQPPNIELGLSKNNTLGSHTAVGSGDNCGSIKWSGSDGTGFVELASINGVCDGATGTGDMPGRIVLSTTADGASSPTERMRITNGGYLLIGCTSLPGSSTKGAGFYPDTNNVQLLLASSSTSTTSHVEFYNTNGKVGTITTSGSATAYNTSSDYRLKENVVPLTGAADRVNQLQVHRFNFIADPNTTVDGFIAHEVQAVVPEAITGEKDAVDDDGKPVYQGIDQSKLVPLLTAALQEAVARIEQLEAEVAALKAQ